MKIKVIVWRKVLTCLLGAAGYALLYGIGYEITEVNTCHMSTAISRALLAFPVVLLLLVGIFFFMECQKNVIMNKGAFSTKLAFLLIFLCYIPYFITVYPGNFVYDIRAQLAQIVSNNYSTHHPLLHTLFLRGCLELLPIMGSLNACAALYSFIQMIVMAMLFVLTAASISRTFSGTASRMSIVFYALYPMHMCFASNMTKDVLFSGFFALFFALCTECTINKKVDNKRALGIIICGTLAVLFRNNMLYALVCWLFLSVLFKFYRKHKRLLLCVFLSAVIGIGINSGLQKILNAEKGDIREMLSWPIQQLARARLNKPEVFTQEEIEVFDEIIPDNAYKSYNPYLSDPVKQHFDSAKLRENPFKYVRLYVDIGRRCYQEYIDAVLELLSPYLYPYQVYKSNRAYIEVGIYSVGFDHHYGEGRVVAKPQFREIREWMERNIWRNGANDIPGVRWIFNLGLIVWLIYFGILKEIYFGNWERVVIGLMPIALLGTCFLGPTMQGRYIYPFVCILPILLSQKNMKIHEYGEKYET